MSNHVFQGLNTFIVVLEYDHIPLVIDAVTQVGSFQYIGESFVQRMVTIVPVFHFYIRGNGSVIIKISMILITYSKKCFLQAYLFLIHWGNSTRPRQKYGRQTYYA